MKITMKTSVLIIGSFTFVQSRFKDVQFGAQLLLNVSKRSKRLAAALFRAQHRKGECVFHKRS